MILLGVVLLAHCKRVDGHNSVLAKFPQMCCHLTTACADSLHSFRTRTANVNVA